MMVVMGAVVVSVVMSTSVMFTGVTARMVFAAGMTSCMVSPVMSPVMAAAMMPAPAMAATASEDGTGQQQSGQRSQSPANAESWDFEPRRTVASVGDAAL